MTTPTVQSRGKKEHLFKQCAKRRAGEKVGAGEEKASNFKGFPFITPFGTRIVSSSLS